VVRAVDDAEPVQRASDARVIGFDDRDPGPRHHERARGNEDLATSRHPRSLLQVAPARPRRPTTAQR
jgi:hypothetical protein